MKHLWLVRYETSSQGTFGKLSSPEGEICHILELPWRDNAANLSCIPVGEYEVEPWKSNRFGAVFHLRNVDGRTFILQHSGNVAGDKTRGWATHSCGCLLFGKYRGFLEVGGHRQKAVLASKAALRAFRSYVQDMPYHLTIMEVYHA